MILGLFALFSPVRHVIAKLFMWDHTEYIWVGWIVDTDRGYY